MIIFCYVCRESLYRLLPQTTTENISKNFEQYTIDPVTRYPNLNSSCVKPHQVCLRWRVPHTLNRLFYLEQLTLTCLTCIAIFMLKKLITRALSLSGVSPVHRRAAELLSSGMLWTYT